MTKTELIDKLQLIAGNPTVKIYNYDDESLADINDVDLDKDHSKNPPTQVIVIA